MTLLLLVRGFRFARARGLWRRLRRHEIAARDLVRACRPGGVIGLVNWTPEGQVGELFRIMGRYMPPPLWGSEEHVRGLFGEAGVDLELERATTPLRFESAEHYVSFMETCYGPTLKARERLTAEGRWDDCRNEIVEMMERRNEATDGSCSSRPSTSSSLRARPGRRDRAPQTVRTIFPLACPSPKYRRASRTSLSS